MAPFTATLAIAGSIPQDLWVAVLDRFVRENCLSVGFHPVEYGTSPALLSESRSMGRGRVSLRREGKRASVTHRVELFEYTAQLHELLCAVENTEWKVYNDDYPADELYFFTENHALAGAQPYEGLITFYELDEEQRRQLEGVDPRIIPNLRQRPDLLITTEICRT